jgi:hypothetical protein
VNSSAAEPSNAAYTNLASGAEGSVADTDYQTAIALCEVENIGNFVALDVYNSTRNGYLKTARCRDPGQDGHCRWSRRRFRRHGNH